MRNFKTELKRVIAAVIFALTAWGAWAQNGGFSIHLGGSFPVGMFGKDVNEDKFDDQFGKTGLCASAGANFGLKGKIPIKAVEGLGIIISGDFIFNGLKGSAKQYYDEEREFYMEYDITTTRPRCMNVPILVGANYSHSFNPVIGVWGEMGFGTNLRIITPIKYTDEDGEWEKISFPIRPTFGMQVGGGIILKEVFSVGFHYWFLGSSTIKFKYSNSEGDTEPAEDMHKTKASIGVFMIRLGFHS
jgi:hypothetical protein